ncbi:MAG: hypothetical protein DIZ80_07485 [endosymbiont of Galathealinum brachiosum]|uniref:Uncharacterized protein n=1 Tax=endosymbiont of Galathealinum brachiosum TaxID=2200906 RepID=A0A370DGC4_9GAMM|nr:MAG: hypothetical protein DIZ80_07485 [endosymbiont of Galathealinum brachiosum]
MNKIEYLIMNKLLTLTAIVTTVLISYGMSSPVDNQLQKKTNLHSTKHEQVTTKPHAGIELNYNRPKKLQVGDSYDLVLNFKTRVSADTLQINIKHDDGLQLGVSQFDYQFAAFKNKKNKITIPVTTLHDGQYYIDISAALITNGVSQARSFSIPVVVGDPSKNKKINAGYISVPSQGVISMPASETTE